MPDSVAGRAAADALDLAGTSPIRQHWRFRVDRQPGPARETLQHVLDQLPEDSAKQRSVILGDLAAVAVSENDPEEACRLSELALDQPARNWYATGMARVRAVRESLSQWESQPCVRSLDERLYDWSTTINALTS